MEQLTEPKYAVVLRFWSNPEEISVIDIVNCINKYTQRSLVKFIDTNGRLWDNVPEEDVILIKNYPDKDDLEDFARLKRETAKSTKKFLDKKSTQIDSQDVSVT